MRYQKHALFVFILGITVALAQPGQPSGPSPRDVVSFLNQTVDWYRATAFEQQLATEPSDLAFVNGNRRLVEQAARLSFEYAKAQAPLLATSAPAPSQLSADTQSAASRYQALLDSANKADKQTKQAQVAIEALKKKLEAVATASQRRLTESAIAENQSELELAETRRDMLRNMVSFIGGASAKGTPGDLRAQIDELERVLPPAPATESKNGETNHNGTAAAPGTVVAAHPEPSGIMALITDVRGLLRKQHALDDLIRQTNDLSDKAKTLRAPLVAELKQVAAEGDALTNEPDSDDPNVLAQQKEALDYVTNQFKQLSSVLLPLGKQRVLLELYKGSLGNWRNAVHAQYMAELRSLLLRLAILAVALAVVIAVSELWRRAIVRYVPEVRRRHQFLLLRRIVTWFVIIIVVAFAFATELGSLATFAGLLTAGVAVALQNVILSIAGYFFLIGKHGVRVGDRVQIQGITGEVVDIGLVRLHLMELGPGGADAQPSGRVVVFSNSVVFQTAGFFKQIPGTNFVWHEMKLTLAAESNYRSVEERLVGAVEKVFADHRDGMERQRRHMQRELSSVTVNSLRPQSRLRLTQSGLDVVIRYPLELENADEVDDRITREVLDAIEREPKLKVVGSGTPNIQPVLEPVAAGHRDRD